MIDILCQPFDIYSQKEQFVYTSQGTQQEGAFYNNRNLKRKWRLVTSFEMLFLYLKDFSVVKIYSFQSNYGFPVIMVFQSQIKR
jgi:phosphate starvation-inducible membrane PsiE